MYGVKKPLTVHGVTVGSLTWREKMQLTLSYIKRAIKNDNRFDQNIDECSEGVVAVWLKDGWSWNPLDGNRHVEHFNLESNHWSSHNPDTVQHWKQTCKMIDKEI
jgi:hypothetical protein